ncbi:MAG TPA: hypothetical protein VFZ59_12805 [Verrucomicrobiae bacterium]|nr:hypothetical protein [Verrucomicrobiae bacterium]
MKQSGLLLGMGLLVATQSLSVGNAHPFEVIARTNAFRLRAPISEEKITPPVARPQITFQGFTTILGRAQVLLSIQRLGATGISCILSENENQDGVTVLEIDERAETVRLNNLGQEQVLALKR